VAAQLVAAAYCARAGNAQATRYHIGNALALLDGNSPSSAAAARVRLGGLAPWQARRVSTHIDANLAGELRIKDLAALVNIGTSHFYRTFKCTFGMSARAWIGRRRIQIAQTLLISTRAPLSEIAFRCGMGDQAHLIRAFRRITGATPHAWRLMCQGAAEDHIADLAGVRASRSPWHSPERGTP